MAVQGKYDEVPSWSGDPAEFESYATACKWFSRATKESERKLVVARLWGRLSGAAKSVVKHLDPDAFEGENGLNAFLSVLRESPLQQLPIPDSFSRLERWSNMRRRDKESISELIVREEELFTELQQALTRARQDRGLGTSFLASEAKPRTEVDPPSTPSRSPVSGARSRERGSEEPNVESTVPPAVVPPAPGLDFFSDELRGYRLLKACRLSHSERQNILVQTSNSTHFTAVRRSLRTLFADDPERTTSKPGRIWWNDDDWWHDSADVYFDDQSWHDGSPGSYGSEEWYDYDSYWNDWYDDWNEPTAYWDSHDQDRYEEELMPDENSNDPEETQLREAFALAGEANKTLQQARDAVRRVRQARGYFAPESMTGKGKSSTGSPSSSTGKGKSSSKGKSGKGFGPCFICNSPHHGYQNCPDRFSKGFSKSSGKGKPGKKGKGFGKSSKGKGKAYFHEVELHVMTVQWDDLAAHGRAHTRVVLDTGATENAVGIDSLHDMIFSGGFQYQVCCSDLPVFKFGNGHRDRAVSRVDLLNTSLGQVSFYVLGGTGRTTPPLLGARTLRSKRTLISYDNGVFLHRTGVVMFMPYKCRHCNLATSPLTWPRSP